MVSYTWLTAAAAANAFPGNEQSPFALVLLFCSSIQIIILTTAGYYCTVFFCYLCVRDEISKYNNNIIISNVEHWKSSLQLILILNVF